MSKKKTVGITIDPHLWELAKNKLDISRSQFVENQIKILLDIDDEETTLLKEIEGFQNEINVRKDKICQIRDYKKAENINNKSIEKAMKSLHRLYDNQTKIGINQIEHIAAYNNVESSHLERLCSNEGMVIVKLFDNGGKNHDNKRVFI